MEIDKATILVVEDEDAIRLSLRDYLVKKDYRVLVASEGVGAIKELLDNQVDLIVTDYRMEILGGDYWIRFLKKYCHDIKVIITSGFLNSAFSIEYPILYKPFEYTKLERIIIDMLEGGSGKSES